MTIITKARLQEFIGLKTPIPWDEVYLEVSYKKGTAYIYIRGEKTPFKADGYGYEKASTLLAEFINYYVGEDKLTCGGAGVSELTADAHNIGIEVNHICETQNGGVFKVSRIKEHTC